MTSPERETFGQLPAVHLASPDGAEAIVTLYGAHVVSWKGARGKEHLFLSRRSALDGSKAIRGGVPVIFPQFAERGTGMRHGFARVLPWRVERSGVDSGGAYAVFVLDETDLPPALASAWPHRFALALRVAVHGNELSMTLDMRNTGAAAFPFAAALHTYHLVDNVAAVRIEGLEAEPVVIRDKLDQVYEGIAGLIAMQSGTSALHHEQSGFTDAVVWNPGAADAAALSDLEDDEYRRFVCIEPALLGPATLEAGGTWRGEYKLRAT
ncbi:D-hexose-6-phosphate mutarotase [Massilia agilis]|uniref:Putative glucose-6-phosphate 1-epimerase n=1 Tax=Massilia agilis TaxID=1811226 RepID=A0ABT2DF44_9BURK|nr:D-hexose-6-phosphate mutarotase [Massilia agilis]MCS0809872.1 D-hexose-6-phosphate mutarotase [Massilia agilis]